MAAMLGRSGGSRGGGGRSGEGCRFLQVHLLGNLRIHERLGASCWDTSMPSRQGLHALYTESRLFEYAVSIFQALLPPPSLPYLRTL